MTIQQTIFKAFEGGYKREVILDAREKNIDVDIGKFGSVLLDRMFWVCLGCAMGWEPNQNKPHQMDSHECWCKPKGVLEGGEVLLLHIDHSWQGYWHSFTQHLIEGKSIESYFEKLK